MTDLRDAPVPAGDGPPSTPSTPSSSAPGSPGCTCCTSCAGWASRPSSSRPATASAARGTGTATRAPAATSRASTTRTRSIADLEQEWDWTERYATQPEILRYANHVADRFDLRRDIQFSTRVDRRPASTSRRSAGRVTTDQGDDVSAQHFVMAVGCLSASKMPEIPGIERFRGNWYHTGHWPHEGVDFTGQRVGVIGTGSSAIQSIPIIAEQAAHLTVFQRTPNFSLPAKNAPLDPEECAGAEGPLPGAPPGGPRESGFGVPSDRAGEVGARGRRRRARGDATSRASRQGNLVGMLLAYNDLITDKAANDTAAEYVRKRIREIVDDPEVAETLCAEGPPDRHQAACLDTDYYATYNRPNVQLVDLRKTPLIEVTERGVRTSRAGVRVRQHRLRHRVRRHDRVAGGVRHQGP